MTLPVKSLSEIEVKSEVSVNDKILILDSDTDEARLASKEELKGDKGDKGDTWETWPQWPQGIQGIQWPKGDKWDTWAKGDKWDTWNTWPKWDKGDKGDTGAKWDKGDKGNTWASIVSWAFSGNDLVFTKDDSNTVTITNAKTDLKWDKWDQWIQGEEWPQWEQGIQWETWETWATWNWIASVTSTKSWKVTTVTITETNGDDYSFTVSDWADWEWSGDVLWPNSSTDWNVVLFDWNTWKLIKDSWKAFTAAWIWALADSTKYWASLTVSLDTTDYKITTTLKDQDWNTLGTAQVIDLPLESVVVSGSYDAINKKVILTLENGNTVEFSVADLVAGLQSEITSSNKLDADLVDDSTSTNKFVTATNKTTWNWKQDALIAWTNISIAADWKTISATDTTYSAASSSSLWLVKLGSDTVQSVATNAVTGATGRTYAMQVNSSWQLVVNIPRTDTTYTASSFDIKDLADSTWLRTTWSGKQDAISTQTAYTTQWTATKVPTITTNTLWQVTAITETNITFPVTSVNNNTWAVTVSEFNPWWTATTWYVVTKTANWYEWAAPSGWWWSFTTTTATLTTAWWSNGEQTVNVTWVTASNTVIVSPDPTSINDYALNSVYCSAQGSGTLTFSCNTVPSSAITVNVLIFD